MLNVVPDKKHIYKEYYVLCSRSRWREQNNMILMLFYVLPGVTHIIMFYVSFHVGRSICKVNVVWPNDFCSFVEGSVSINGAEFSICVLSYTNSISLIQVIPSKHLPMTFVSRYNIFRIFIRITARHKI